MDLLWQEMLTDQQSCVHFHVKYLVHIGLESTKKRINTKIHSILHRIILTLVASAFTPFTNRTSESASVYNGICEVEQCWFTFCSCYSFGCDVNDARWATAGDCGRKKKKEKKMIHGCYAQPSFHAVMHLIMPLKSNVLYSACLPI